MRRIVWLIVLICQSLCLGQTQTKPMLGNMLDSGDPINLGLGCKWLFNEGAGSLARDLSGNQINGTISGASWVPGDRGPCLNFNGTSDYVDCGTGSVIAGTQLTVSAMVKHPTAAGDEPYHRIVSKYNDSAWSSMCFFLSMRSSSPNYYGFDFQVPTTDNLTTVSTDWVNSSLYYGKWVHVVGVYDGAYLRLYLNGIESATPTAKSVSITPAQTTRLYIGRTENESGSPRYMRGSIDHVEIYNRALSSSEIQRLYLDLQAGIQRDPIALYAASAPAGGSKVPVLQYYYNQMRAGFTPVAIPIFVVLSMAFLMRKRGNTCDE